MKKIMLNRLLIIILMSIGFKMHGALPCASGPTTSNTAIISCVDSSVSGNLSLLVSGGSGPLTFAATGPAPVGGMVTIGASGTFLFTPTTGFTGNGSFSFIVTDTEPFSATGAISITIFSPVISNESLVDCSSTGIVGNLISLVSSGFPPYIFALAGTPIGGAASVSASGAFNFTSTPGFNGAGGFTFEVVDSNNCLGTGAVDIAIGSPITATAALSTCDDSLAGNLTAFVTGGTPPYTFVGIGPASCSGASLTIDASGPFNYTAPVGFTGPCSFVYEVLDSNACNSTGSVTVTANLIPIASDASYTGCRNVPVVQTFPVVGGVPPLAFTIVSPPVNGAVTVDDSTEQFTYTPNTGYIGGDSFTYDVTDSSVPPCTSNIGTITLTINNCCTPINNLFFSLVVSEFNSQLPI